MSERTVDGARSTGRLTGIEPNRRRARLLRRRKLYTATVAAGAAAAVGCARAEWWGPAVLFVIGMAVFVGCRAMVSRQLAETAIVHLKLLAEDP